MKVLLIPHNYKPFFNGGGETYLHNLSKWLQVLGHEVKAIVAHPKPYEYDGIFCFAQGGIDTMWHAHRELMQWCDVVVTQLWGTAYAYNKAHQFGKPLIFVAHNTSKSYPISFSQNTYVIYNSEWLKKEVNFDHPSFVLRPLIDYTKYSPAPGSERKYITLVNCNENKGGKQFIELAKLLPEYEFLGVKGAYGEQITDDLANLTYVECGADITEHLKQTKILLMPSEMETYGQAATEAICAGIPVLCSSTEGLKENLSYAGIYIERKDVNLYAHNIKLLFNDPDYYKLQSNLCLKRAKELDPATVIKKFNEWLINIK